jgi:hypothetical protein
MESKGETFKPDLESTLIRVIMYLFVLNAPFLGVYKALARGTLDAETYPFLAVGGVCLLASLHFCRRFFGIRFGWDEEYVFKRGVFRHTRIRWDEITKVYETGIAQEWTEGDMLFLRKKGTGKKLFVIRSKDKKIVLEFYKPMIAFRKTIAERLNLQVESQYNAVWDFIVNT